jgi:predicted tellurium resistance membrane protein TerC
LFEFLGLDVLASLFQVVLINLVLASDNVIVIGLAAAAQPHARRRRVGYTNPADRRGLLLAGGILLLWVCWKIWRELRAFSAAPIEATEDAGAVAGADADGEPRNTLVRRSGRSLWPTFLYRSTTSWPSRGRRDHPVVLIFGLALSIAMMGATLSQIRTV